MIRSLIVVYLLFISLGFCEEASKPVSSIHETQDSELKKITPQLLTAVTVVTAGGLFLTAKDAREYVKDRWEQLMSPMHAHASNKGAFKFRSIEEERMQTSHCDKGCHFIFSYLAMRPLAYGFQWILNDIPTWMGGTGRAEGGLSRRAVVLSALLTSFGGFYEEFVDGHEKDEGFSAYDHLANECGVLIGSFKLLGYLERVDLYWAYTPPSRDYIWPLWTYMQGYRFKLNIDLTDVFFKQKPPRNTYFDKWAEVTGFLPQVFLPPTNNPSGLRPSRF